MTQREVAELLHIDRSTYAYYELGKTSPSLTNLLAMARLFDVPVDLLIDDKTELPAAYALRKNTHCQAKEGSLVCPVRPK